MISKLTMLLQTAKIAHQRLNNLFLQHVTVPGNPAAPGVSITAKSVQPHDLHG